MDKKLLVVRSHKGTVDVWWASLDELLESCMQITGAKITKLYKSDKNYFEFDDLVKEVLKHSFVVYQFVYKHSLQPEQPIVRNSAPEVVTETLGEIFRMFYDEYYIFHGYEGALAHSWAGPEIRRAIEDCIEEYAGKKDFSLSDLSEAVLGKPINEARSGK